jgi:hypothetical protein
LELIAFTHLRVGPDCDDYDFDQFRVIEDLLTDATVSIRQRAEQLAIRQMGQRWIGVGQLRGRRCRREQMDRTLSLRLTQ